ncbi:DNA-binding transcriptional regulator [Luteolibacter sp. LG18]|uniref:AraC family transcriptional regulator n=1 Tax=Luteolibacter sp. LG18 TaxID=2819286 RepID=UPI002B29EECC|nr:XylR family transcriptional regulator [Luteolibacter sp. LG18]
MRGKASDHGKPKQKNVLLALGWHDHRLLNGIASYATEHNWHISAASITKELTIPWGWEGDGVLAWLAGSDELCEFVRSLKKPTVDFSLRRANLPFAHVAQDHLACATMAAEHFLRRGFRNFMFYSDSDNWTFEERGTGFVKALAAEGYGCEWLKWHRHKHYRQGRGEWSSRRAWLTTQLRKAEKPLAVFTANGTLAVEVLEVCEHAEIQIPRDVALIGIEDDLLLPQSTQRPITSVEPNFEELGYQGSAWLDRLMRGGALPAAPVRVAPSRIISRQSTDITAVSHEGLAKALRFIAGQFHDSIDIDQVARHSGMSRRGLHQAFVDHLGMTPGEHLRSTRIENAKRLLCETDQKVESVAAGSGYPSVNSFFIAFRQAAGTTPAEYRKLARRGR